MYCTSVCTEAKEIKICYLQYKSNKNMKKCKSIKFTNHSHGFPDGVNKNPSDD